jgi:hypothetical protein
MVKVVSVVPRDDYKIKICLDNGKTGLFDVVPFLDKGFFTELKDLNCFRQVLTRGRSISWPHSQDFCADTIDALLHE